MFPVVIWWKQNTGSGHSNETDNPEHLFCWDLLSNQYKQPRNTTTAARLLFSDRKPSDFGIWLGVKKQQHVHFLQLFQSFLSLWFLVDALFKVLKRNRKLISLFEIQWHSCLYCAVHVEYDTHISVYQHLLTLSVVCLYKDRSIDWLIDSFIYFLTDWFTFYLFVYWVADCFTYLFIDWLIYLFIYLLICLLTDWLVYLFIGWLIYLFIYLLICLLTDWLVYLFTDWLIYLFIYLLICLLTDWLVYLFIDW